MQPEIPIWEILACCAAGKHAAATFTLHTVLGMYHSVQGGACSRPVLEEACVFSNPISFMVPSGGEPFGLCTWVPQVLGRAPMDGALCNSSARPRLLPHSMQHCPVLKPFVAARCGVVQARDRVLERLAEVESEEALRDQELEASRAVSQLKAKITHLEKTIESYQVRFQRRLSPSKTSLTPCHVSASWRGKDSWR